MCTSFTTICFFKIAVVSMNSNPSEAEEEGINLFLLPINEELDEFEIGRAHV